MCVPRPKINTIIGSCVYAHHNKRASVELSREADVQKRLSRDENDERGEKKDEQVLEKIHKKHERRAEAEILSEAAPVVVWRLIDAIEKHGMSSESLYRAPPASGGPAELRHALDSGKHTTNHEVFIQNTKHHHHHHHLQNKIFEDDTLKRHL
ncbi:hypothetical protein PAMA_001042 [Pampus argenteus]